MSGIDHWEMLASCASGRYSRAIHTGHAGNMRDIELWDRLKKFRFDADQGDAPFSVKLAHAEDWTDDYTARVIEEYRKFLYLSQISESQITPSVPVDRAWHMHLTFTKSYWEELCDGVIGRKLHHNPCASEAEMPLYRSQYEATKLLYRREFDTAPPEDIWPGDATRDPVEISPFYSKLAGSIFILSIASFVGIPLAGFRIIPLSHWYFVAGFAVCALLSVVVGSMAKSKHRRDKRRADSETWFAFEYGRRRRDDDGDGDGDGDGGGGCGD